MDNFDLKKYLAEGRLFEEDFKNPILDKYLELKKSIDYKTVFPTDLQSFVDSLDNTEREGLESDLGLERDELYEGRLLKENQLVNDILGNQAEVEKQLDTKLKDFKIAGDDRVLTAVDPEEFTVYAFKYADEAGEDFKSDEGYDPEIITIDRKKIAVTVGNI